MCNLVEDRNKTIKALQIINTLLKKIWGGTIYYNSDGISLNVDVPCEKDMWARYYIVDRKVYSEWSFEGRMIQDINGDSLKDFIKFYPMLREKCEAWTPLVDFYITIGNEEGLEPLETVWEELNS